jgi:putative oxidoreductase
MFVLRLVTGLIFIMHGSMKIGSMPMIVGFFGHLGFAPAAFWAWFAALLEVIGGAALILGVATRFFGILLAIEMIVAIIATGIGRGWGAHEFELLLAAASTAIAMVGSGRASLFKMECDNCGGMFCDGEVCVVDEAA